MIRAYGAAATSLLCSVWKTNENVDIARPIVVMYTCDPIRSSALLSQRFGAGFPVSGSLFGQWERCCYKLIVEWK
jgi:hypothetical protein